jgi:methyl-accepting chemotaxis protein
MAIAAVLLASALISMGLLFYQVRKMEPDAHVANYAGMVRGMTQRLVKLELTGTPSDELINITDKAIRGLLEGVATLGLPPARDTAFRGALEDTQRDWQELKGMLSAARKDPTVQPQLLESSEDFFTRTNNVVATVESMAEGKVRTAEWMLFGLGALSLAIVAAIGYITRSMTLRLNRTISSLAATSTQMASSAEVQERVASEQAVATNQTTTTIEQLGESSKLSATQSEATARETSNSLQLAQQGSATVEKTLQTMTNLKQNVSAVAQEILSLSERIDQIGEISTFVGDLANQTNMLALNAAVEAAHAGEQGKGFAVVATEIRKLADQSTKSVSRINDLVGDIQQATNAAVMATEQGTKVVDEGMQFTAETAAVFNNLGNTINRASESVQQISLNIKEQSTGIDQVVEAIESLNAGARESADDLKQTSRGLQTLNGAVLELREVVGSVNSHGGG